MFHAIQRHMAAAFHAQPLVLHAFVLNGCFFTKAGTGLSCGLRAHCSGSDAQCYPQPMWIKNFSQ
jgi:hypothetical protein